jgi:flagellar biosynthesis chaperone FliJ
MKRFSFPLGRVLDWKTVVAQQEQTTLGALEQRRSDIQKSLLSLDESIRGLCEFSQETVSGHELACSARARSAAQKKKAVTQKDHALCSKAVVVQQQRFRTAETERRLLDKLRDRSRSEWTANVSRDTDSQASDLYLGLWNRR